VELLAVAAWRPDAHENCCDSDDHGQYQQGQMHRLQEGTLRELRNLPALRPHLPGDRKRLGQGFQSRTSNLLGEAGEGGTERIAVLGGNHRPGDGDANRGADLARRVVDGRRNPCFASGTAPMIADVVGATHNPMPALTIRMGQRNSR